MFGSNKSKSAIYNVFTRFLPIMEEQLDNEQLNTMYTFSQQSMTEPTIKTITIIKCTCFRVTGGPKHFKLLDADRVNESWLFDLV